MFLALPHGRNSKKHNALVAVASLSMRLVGKYMQPYSCAKSQHKFKQAQLMTCLILRACLNATYRRVIDVLDASETLRIVIGLKQLHHNSTLKHYADRAGTLDIVDAMLREVAKRLAKDDE